MTKRILGVEIGGTKLQLAVGTTNGEILDKKTERVNPKDGGAGIRQWLKDNIPAFISSIESTHGRIAAIGCGFGGPINSREGRVLKSIQIDGWQDFPIKAWFQDTFLLSTTVENDSNAAAWGEYQQGAGSGCNNFFYTNMGSGVGGGFVLEGKLYDGQGFGAGEFGHTYVPDWTSNSSGAAQKIENLCSGWAIETRLRQPGYVPETSELYRHFSGKLTKVTTRDLADSAKRGDRFSCHEIDQVAYSMGLGLANVLSLTNVERIAIGGGVSKMGDLLLDPIRTYTEQFAFVSSQGRYEIRQAALSDDVVVVGAILLAKDRFKLS